MKTCLKTWQNFINLTAKFFFSKTKILKGEKIEMFGLLSLQGPVIYIFVWFRVMNNYNFLYEYIISDTIFRLQNVGVGSHHFEDKCYFHFQSKIKVAGNIFV
jgi:hypothetical protein